MCMAGTQNMGMGAGTQSGNYYPSAPPVPPPQTDASASSDGSDEAKVWDYTKVADNKK